MSGRRSQQRILYWDTCVFLAWIKRETGWPVEVTKGIEQSVEQIYAKQLVVITSAITVAEVLGSNLTAQHKQQFREVFKHPNLELMDVDRRIIEKASVILERYDTRIFNADGSKLSGSIMGMGDAIHLATAIHYNVNEFQTLDGSGKRKRRLDLLKLNGNVADSFLRIVQPKYIEPLQPLEGPLSPFDPRQAGLWDETDGKTETKIEPEPTKVRGGSVGHPKSRSHAKGSKEKTESKEAGEK